MLEVFVAPLTLWFQGKLESLGTATARRLGVPTARIPSRAATKTNPPHERVELIRSAVAKHVANPPAWREDAESPALVEQLGAWHVAGSFTSWMRKTSADSNKGWKWATQFHDFYVPLDFPDPIPVDFVASIEGLSCGSSTALLAELDDAATYLGVSRDWGQLATGESMAQVEDPLANQKTTWGIWHYAARVSITSRMPLIIDG